MPIKSEKQKKLMQAVEHNPEFAKKVGIKPSVAKKMLHPNLGKALADKKKKKKKD